MREAFDAAARRLTAHFVLAVLVALLCAIPLALPGRAFATYADCDEDHAAAQELGVIDDPIYASSIPDGTYEIEARTDSSMCVFYRNADDADAKVSKEKCYVQIANGKMTAVFYLTGMYTRLHLGGDAEAAAALTDKSGSDDSKYLKGDPSEGYVPHLYTMAIPALNYPMDFAAFAGGKYPVSPDSTSTWYTRAKWYSHTVVFKPTKAVADAIAGENADPKSEQPQQPQQPQQQQPQPQPQLVDPETPAGTPEAMPASGDSLEGVAQSQFDGDSGATSADGTGSGGRRRAVISPAVFDIPDSGGGEGVEKIERADLGEDQAFGSIRYLFVGGAALLVAGVGYRVVAYALARRPIRAQVEGQSQE